MARRQAFRGALALLVGIVFAGMACAEERGKPPAQNSPCYAFLLNGDVWVICNGQRKQITRFDDVEDFAVAFDPSVLALARYRLESAAKAHVQTDKPEENVIISEGLQLLYLKKNVAGRLMPFRSAPELAASCGTIISISRGPPLGKQPGLARDLLSGRQLRFEPYKNFRCDSSRKFVVGWTDPNRTVLEAGLPPQRELLSNGPSYEIRYDVSPNGRFVVYNTLGKLCVFSTDGPTKCISEGLSQGRISISDSGDVIFETATDQPCYYKDQFHASTKPRPGYRWDDLCRAVGYWRPGDKEVQMLELLGRDPQWITPEAASALVEWSRRQHPSQRPTRQRR